MLSFQIVKLNITWQGVSMNQTSQAIVKIRLLPAWIIVVSMNEVQADMKSIWKTVYVATASLMSVNQFMPMFMNSPMSHV